MTLGVMWPTDAVAGKRVVVMITGLSGEPAMADVAIDVSGLAPTVTTTWDPARAKYTIEIPTKSGDEWVRVSVKNPGGRRVVGTVTLAP